MKKGFYTIGSIIILLIAGLVFIVAPAIVGNGRGQGGTSFGSYNGKQIRYEQGSDFANIVSQYADMYSQMGYQIDTSTYYYIFSNAFNQTVQQMAYADAVEKSGWQVPEQAVNRMMLPYFSDENGNYSPRLYHQADQNQLTELRSQIEKSLVINRYYDDVFGSAETVGTDKLFGIKSSAEEIFFINTMGETMRSFDIATFNMDNYPDSEKISYGQKNSEKFEKYDMSVITLSTRRDAEAVFRQINNNSITFDDAVGANSNRAYSNYDGKLAENYRYQLEMAAGNSDDFAKLASLPVGSISDIIQTGSNFSIFRIDGDMSKPDFSDDDTVRDVFSYLNTYEAGIIEDYFMEKAQSLVSVAKTEGFEAACIQLDANITHLLPFPINYGSVSVMGTTSTGNAGLSTAGVTEQFWVEGFSLKEGEISNPMVIDNSIAILRYNGIVDASSVQKDAQDEAYVEDAYFSGGITDENNSSISSQLETYDSSSAQTVLMSSPKIKNNVMTVLLGEFFTNASN